MNDETEHKIIRQIDTAFERLAMELDSIAVNAHIYSDDMMNVIRKYGDFITYYAEWIREVWDYENNEVVEG